MTTASELLDATNAAILRALTSQEYQGPGGRRQRMADLAQLRETRKQLMQEVADASEGGGSMSSLGSFMESTR
jgi:hypothetical protein